MSYCSIDSTRTRVYFLLQRQSHDHNDVCVCVVLFLFTFLFCVEGTQQFLLLVQALQENHVLRVPALPQGLDLIPGLLMLLPQALFFGHTGPHLLTQPPQLRLVLFRGDTRSECFVLV